MKHAHPPIQPTTVTVPAAVDMGASHQTQRVVHVPERFVPGGWIIGAPSRLLDVWTPTPLILRATAFRYPRHPLTFTLTHGSSAAPAVQTHWLKRLRSKPSKQHHRFNDSDLVFDCRHDSTGNVAHVLQNQIGVALHSLRAFGMEDRWRDLVFVVREGTADYSIRLFETLGFRTLKTSGDVTGALIRMAPVKFPLRSIASEVLRPHALRIGLLTENAPAGEAVFLARRGRRTLTNMDEVEPMINRAGYRTVHLEDLPAEEQIRTVATARAVWGLHGAGMGFIMFRDPARPGVVVECFSSGFATNWARANAAATNSLWIGGQGEFDCGAIRHMQRGDHSHTHEADNYRLDPATASALLRVAEAAASDPNILQRTASMDEMLAVLTRGAGSGIPSSVLGSEGND
jgi:hypothetical protein